MPILPADSHANPVRNTSMSRRHRPRPHARPTRPPKPPRSWSNSWSPRWCRTRKPPRSISPSRSSSPSPAGANTPIRARRAAFNAKRYKWVKKKMERTDVVPGRGETDRIQYRHALRRMAGRHAVRGQPLCRPLRRPRRQDRADGRLERQRRAAADAQRHRRLSRSQRLALAAAAGPRAFPARSARISLMSRSLVPVRGTISARPATASRCSSITRRRALCVAAASAAIMARCSLTAHSDECGRL